MPAHDPSYDAPKGTQPMHWEPVEPDIPAMRSPARELVGKRAELDPDEPVALDEDLPRPQTMLELERTDRIVSLGVIEAPARRRPLTRHRYQHLMVAKWLDRFGYMTTEQIHRAVLPNTSARAIQALLRQMRDAGLVERRRTQLEIEEGRRRGGSAPRIYSLTGAGYRFGQRSPGFHGSVIPRRGGRRRSEAQTPMRLRHDLHTIGWWQAFDAALRLGVDMRDVLTPRYDDGRLQPPRIPIGRHPGWRPVELRDVLLRDAHVFAGVPDMPFRHTLEPDLSIQLEVFGFLLGRNTDIRVDLLIEMDRTERPSHNRQKFERYDAFLTGWGLLHPRVVELDTRPIVVFVSPTDRAMLALMRTADEVMTGRLGWMGDPEHAWYFPGRDHVLFAVEDEIHRGSMLAFRLPAHPRGLREQLGDDRLIPKVVTILPPELTATL